VRRKSRRSASVGRSIGVAEHHFHAGLTRLNMTGCVALACLTALVLFPAVSAHATPTTDRLAAARAAVDRIAQRWFQAENDAAQIDTKIAATQHQLDAAQARVKSTATVATARAIALYMTNDEALNSVFASDALDSARRSELADEANQQSVDDINALTSAVDDLKAQEQSLQAQRAHQQQVLRDVASQRDALDAQLAVVRAQADREAAVALRHARSKAALARAQARLASLVTAPASNGSAAPTRNVTATTLDTPTASAPAPSGGGVNPHHDDPFLVCTRARESSGIYTAVSPSGYYGAYQFLPSTWDTTAVHAGRMDLVGVLPSRASEYDQDEMAWTLYQWQGKGPWGGRC